MDKKKAAAHGFTGTTSCMTPKQRYDKEKINDISSLPLFAGGCNRSDLVQNESNGSALLETYFPAKPSPVLMYWMGNPVIGGAARFMCLTVWDDRTTGTNTPIGMKGDDPAMNVNQDLFDMQEVFNVLFSADTPERKDWLERITPAELEWYYEQQYIH